MTKNRFFVVICNGLWLKVTIFTKSFLFKDKRAFSEKDMRKTLALKGKKIG